MWFRRKPKSEPEPVPEHQVMDLGDDPLGYSDAGVIRLDDPNDPRAVLFRQAMSSQGIVANRRDDGLWDVRPF